MPSPSERAGAPDTRVLDQLVEALLYEGLAGPVAAEGARRSWSLGRSDYRCTAQIGPFGRVRVAAGSVEARGADAGWAPAELRPLVEALAGEPAPKARLLAELEQTVALRRWNAANVARADRRGLDFAELDAAIDEGHLYHPCFKARTGFDLADHAAYGPEAGRTFRLVWLAVARPLLSRSLPDDEARFWADELGPETLAELHGLMAARGIEPEGYGLLPLHPWQWRDMEGGALAPLIADGSVHPLGQAGDRYRATQSLRTLANADRPEKANVKLALNVVNTSALRTIEPHSVATAPALSRWLEDVVSGDPLFAARYKLAILPEYAGVVADRDGPLGGRLAALWRRSVASVLAAGEEAAPFNALALVESDGRPFIDVWVRRHGLIPWLDRLLDVAVTPVWHLLAAHGIATEAHGQNMVLVHRDGWPERLILRDFHDSVEFCPGFLRDPAAVPDFAAIDSAYRDATPNRFHAMADVEELRALVMDCLFVFNLAEVSHLLATAYGVPEAEVWRRIERRIAGHAAEHGLEDRVAELRHDAPGVAVERLLARKLYPGREACPLVVPNTLARPSARDSEAS